MTTTNESAGVKPAIISDEELHVRFAWELTRLAERVHARHYSIKAQLWCTDGVMDTQMEWGGSVHLDPYGCETATGMSARDVIEKLAQRCPNNRARAARKREQATQLLLEAQKLEEANT